MAPGTSSTPSGSQNQNGSSLKPLYGADRDENNNFERGVIVNRTPPSTADLSTLQSILLKDLQSNVKHFGRVLYLRITNISLLRGMLLVVQDCSGTSKVAYSIIEYPCPGGQSAMCEGSFIAIKEPYYGVCLAHPNDGYQIITGDAPSDFVRLSKFGQAAKTLFPQYAGAPLEDFSRAGNVSFAAGKMMDAIDIYSEGIRVARKVSNNIYSISDLLLKRGFAYARLELHTKALLDITKVLIDEPTNCKALKLACISCLALEKYQAAKCYACGLLALDPKNTDSKEIWARVMSRVKQALGKYDWPALIASAKNGKPEKETSTFVGDIEVRRSSLGGRGVFAKRKFCPGDLLLCEKPIVVCYDTSDSSWGNGLTNEERGVDGRWMSVLQQLATTAIQNPVKAQQLFNLFDGSSRRSQSGASHQGYDTSRANKILTHNHHRINRGSASDDHRFYSTYNSGSAFELPTADTPGLWYTTSLFNHSCLPNATYAWTGDLMHVHALRDIDKGEELTLSYVGEGALYDMRKELLGKFDFDCLCTLCKVEADLEDELSVRKELMLLISQVGNIDQLEQLMTSIVLTYNGPGYHYLPFSSLLHPLFFMAHNYMGPVAEWHEIAQEWRDKAIDTFKAILELACDIRLIEDPKSGYCEPTFTKASQPSPYSVAALVGIAEIVYTGKPTRNLKRVATLLEWALHLYKRFYGEDVTFKDHHGQYKCKEALSYVGTFSPPPHWDEVANEQIMKPMTVPAVLNNRFKGTEDKKSG